MIWVSFPSSGKLECMSFWHHWLATICSMGMAWEHETIRFSFSKTILRNFNSLITFGIFSSILALISNIFLIVLNILITFILKPSMISVSRSSVFVSTFCFFVSLWMLCIKKCRGSETVIYFQRRFILYFCRQTEETLITFFQLGTELTWDGIAVWVWSTNLCFVAVPRVAPFRAF